jgi:hypothetical protein
MGSDLDAGWAMGNGVTDTTSAVNTWRNGMDPVTTNSLRMSSLWTSFMLNYTAWSTSLPRFEQPGAGGSQSTVNTIMQWQDNSYSQKEAVIGWSPDSSTASRGKLKGQIYGGMLVSGQFAGESTITFDGHTFMAITDQTDITESGATTLYVAVD